LGLSGATAGQFRMLGVWPSGNYKWIEVCGIVPTLAAGGTASVSLTNSGSGNFGGTNLAIDNGSTITVATGAATFTVKKANFNVVDKVMIGNSTVVASGTSQGLVLSGPNPLAAYPANVTCGTGSGQSPCTTAYSSANDPNSTCTVEKNGPVEAVLKCTGDHVDAAGHIYMHFTVREYFYQGKTNLKITSSLRNADYGTSGTFATAYKGHQGYELRITPNISSAASFAFANHTGTPTTGTLRASIRTILGM
jgi:YetA-like protein